MQSKSTSHVIQGMQKDTSKSKLSKEFAFDAKNIRITAIDDNSLLSITNERGNKKIAEVPGSILGHYILDNKLIVFSKVDSENKPDYIILYNSNLRSEKLYTGNLGFKADYKIEAIGLVENENIKKVYWVDGINPPRYINIKKDWREYNDLSFDFIPSLSLNETVTVETGFGISNFSPGVIQYAFSYYSKHGSESNIFYTSELVYLTPNNRGASPEEKINNTVVSISINNLEIANFDYLRIYSIHRTSIDAVPTVKIVTDLNITSTSLSYVDTGFYGETIDPTLLFYIGGEDIIASTLTAKDNTLFLGNVALRRLEIPQEVKNLASTSIACVSREEALPSNSEGLYLHNNFTTNNFSYYKYGEHYILGIQFQHKSGKWSEPCALGRKEYLNTNTITPKHPYISGTNLVLPAFSFTLYSTEISALRKAGYVKARGIVVFPQVDERKIVAQGILNPTVYNDIQRRNNNPYAQSSWFFRPNLGDVTSDLTLNKLNGTTEAFTYGDKAAIIDSGSAIEFRHGKPIITGPSRGSEIQNEYSYKVDTSMFTFHSPDVEFNNISLGNNLSLNIVGAVMFSSAYGDIDIQTSTSTLDPESKGFVHRTINNPDGAKSLISGLFYNDISAKATGYDPLPRLHLVYPWHRSGSVNDDSSSLASNENRTQSAILQKKKLSNIKIAKNNLFFSTPFNISNLKLSNIECFNSDQVSLIKIKDKNYTEELNYYGNIDTLLNGDSNYGLYYSDTWHSELETSEVSGTESVRMKYKSSPHLVMKIISTDKDYQEILPSLNGHCIQNDVTITDKEEFEASTLGDKAVGIVDKMPSASSYNAGDLIIFNNSIVANTYNKDTFFEVWICKGTGTKEWAPYVYTMYENPTKRVYYETSTNTYEIYHYGGPINYSSPYYEWIYDGTVQVTVEGSKKTIVQGTINDTVIKEFPDSYLYLAEIVRDTTNNPFSQNDNNKYRTWLPASKPVLLSDSTKIIYCYGDTRYQRYDCLKTYAFTPEDENQVVEIASFMCETRSNLTGRYDKNIGKLSNLNADNTNFNLYNNIYEQKDNFFNYRILDEEFSSLNNFPNTLTWSKEKHLGEEIDTWTNITMASTLDLDGTKGKLNKLITFKDQIFAFQDRGISNVLFNSRVQIPVSDGVPIELSNSMKVEGIRCISDSVGCQNKNSIVTTSSGVYFLDSETSNIYLLADGITNLSNNKGFSIWTKEVARDSSFRTFYDKNNQDVYFTTKDYCLGYSEKLGQFISFYDYNGVSLMFNLNSDFYSVKNGYAYQHYAGEYNKFYGEYKPYSITIISNDNPYTDKIFNTVEYRADLISKEEGYRCESPFDTLEVWNEYQKGETSLVFNKYAPSSLKKKFRMWRANIPRDCKNKLDRMRNPWLYIKLSNNSNLLGGKMELHDIMVHYFE